MGAGSVAEAVGSGGMLVGGGVSVGVGAGGVAVTSADIVVVGSRVAVGAAVGAVELVAAVGLLMLAVNDDEHPTIVSSTNAPVQTRYMARRRLIDAGFFIISTYCSATRRTWGNYNPVSITYGKFIREGTQ